MEKKKKKKSPTSARHAERKSKLGPIKKPIDWEKASYLCKCGCPGTEVAAYFGVHYDTLADRCLAELGIYYSEFSHMHDEKGKTSLRHKQFDQALKGDRGMLIWLGKNRLDQRDKPKDDNTDGPTLDQFVKLMEALKDLQR